MDKKILLIAFKYPSYRHVGSFRWTKLSKYLAKLGYTIHVVTVEWKQECSQNLLEDINNPNIIIHRIPSGYPHNYKTLQLKNKIINGFYWRFWKLLDKLLKIEDEAYFWGRFLLPFCSGLIEKHKIKLVITTGAPFMANFWSAKLKTEYAEIKLIQDFRDPWANNPVFKYSAKQKEINSERQKQSIDIADAIVTVSRGLMELFVSKENFSGIQKVIPNGYDPDSKIHFSKIDEKKSAFSFTYIGSLASGRDEPLICFLDAIDLLKKIIPEIKVNLIGLCGLPIVKKYRNLINDKILLIQPYMTQERAFEVVQNSSFALHFNAKELPFALSTKIFEYGMLKIPTISLNYGGEIEQLIVENSLGYSLNVEREDIYKFITKLYQNESKNFTFNIEKYSYEQIALEYDTLIQKVLHNRN